MFVVFAKILQTHLSFCGLIEFSAFVEQEGKKQNTFALNAKSVVGRPFITEKQKLWHFQEKISFVEFYCFYSMINKCSFA